MDNQSNVSQVNKNSSSSSQKISIFQKIKKEIKSHLFSIFFNLQKDEEISIYICYVFIIFEVIQVLIFQFNKKVRNITI